MAAVVIKASVYAGFKMLWAWCSHTAIMSFLISIQRTVLFFASSFWGYFLLKPCKMGDFGCLKDKNREKDMGKGRGECGGSRTLLRE